MDQAVKEYADAMERGWLKCPYMSYKRFFIGDSRLPDACCANGHAALGSSYADANAWAKFEKTVQHIKVGDPSCAAESCMSLSQAIDILVLQRWSTPQIILWIRENNQYQLSITHN